MILLPAYARRPFLVMSSVHPNLRRRYLSCLLCVKSCLSITPNYWTHMGDTKYYYEKPKDSRLKKVQKSWVFYRRKRPSKAPAICSHFFSPPMSSVEVNSGVCVYVCVCVSSSVVSDSLQPYGLQPARLLHPWDFLGKNTAVGWHFFLQGIFPTRDQTQVSHTTRRLFTIWDKQL